MDEEILQIIEKLPEEDRERIKDLIEEQEERIKQLENNLKISADILQGILDQVRSIQISLNTIYRLVRPIVRGERDVV